MDEIIPKQSVNPSSLVDLKAELFRKQEEFKTQKLQTGTFIKGRVTEKKPNIWSKKNAGVLQRAERDLEAKAEEENSLEKSRKALAAKAKIYEKLTQGNEIPEEDGSKIFLVDFQKKVIDTIMEKRDEEQKVKAMSAQPSYQSYVDDNTVTTEDKPANAEEEWVEFTDSLGRARACMRKDLPELQRQDKALNSHKKSSDTRDKPDLLSDDMRRELEREQWEREEQESLNKPTGPVHYADVQHNEVRDHGIGYYQFSQQEEDRQAEMERLAELRKQTIDQRTKREQIKEKRKAMLESRLAKVKQRKLGREGGGVFSQAALKQEPKVEEKLETKDNKLADIKDKEVEAKVASLLHAVRKEENKTAAVREWDIGKTEYLNYQWENHKQNLEDERNPDFAPPVALYSMESASQNKPEFRGRRNFAGRVWDPKASDPPQVKVYTREEYEEQCQKSSQSGMTRAMNTEREVENIQDIPLPAEQGAFSRQSTSSQSIVKTLNPISSAGIDISSSEHNRDVVTNFSANPANVSVNQAVYTQPSVCSVGHHYQFAPPVFDGTVPPPVFDTSQPPPGYVPPQVPSNASPVSVTSSGPPGNFVGTLSNPGVKPVPAQIMPLPNYQAFSHPPNPTPDQHSAQDTSTIPESVVILPKLHIMDTRYIKNKEASVLASLTSTEHEESSHVTTTTDTGSTSVLTNSVISGAPVRYKTEDK